MGWEYSNLNLYCHPILRYRGRGKGRSVSDLNLYCHQILRYSGIEVNLNAIEVLRSGVGMWPFPNLCCYWVLNYFGEVEVGVALL